MLNYWFTKSPPQYALWFGINGYRYNCKRYSPSRNAHVIDKGWLFYIHIFGYELSINREKTKEINNANN